MRNNGRIILLDVGGTFIKSALGIPFNGAVENTFESTPVNSDGSAEEIRAAFRKSVSVQMHKADEEGFSIDAVCVAIPGPFDYNEGIFMMKHKFSSVYGVSFKDMLKDVLPSGTRLAFIHDVNCALLGAMISDSSLKEGNVALSTLGTGLGFTYAVDGEVQYSPTGSPATGLWNLPYNGAILEEYVSRRAIIRTFLEKGGALNAGEDVKEIADLARKGDKAAMETFAATGRHYAAGSRETLKRLGVRHLLFGGQIAKSFCLMEEEIRKGLGDIVTISVLDDIQGTVLLGASTL